MATREGPRPAAADEGGRCRVTVIIPCFDDGLYVAQAAHSIVEPEPVEIVIVDDGSSDEYTLDVLGRLEREGFRVIHLSENGGVADARTAGLAQTSARYVFPLDADDLAEPGALAAMADLLDASPDAAVCLGDFIEFHENERVGLVSKSHQLPQLDDGDRRSPRALLRREQLADGSGSGAGKLLHLGEHVIGFARQGVLARGGAGSPTGRARAPRKRPPSVQERRALAEALGAASRVRTVAPGQDQGQARVAVIVLCDDDGEAIGQAARSVDEREPVDVIIVESGAHGPATATALEQLRDQGYEVLVAGPGADSIQTALAATAARYVFVMSACDLAVPGALSDMADRLDADPSAGGCLGNYIELRRAQLVRAAPPRVDPYRLAYTNEYPNSQMYRRSDLEDVGGWMVSESFEDWDLWMSLAERGAGSVHLGQGRPVYRWRIHKGRRSQELRRKHRRLYLGLRDRHPELFGGLREHRRETDLSRLRRVLYPIVYGARPRLSIEQWIKNQLDRFGIWTAAQR